MTFFYIALLLLGVFNIVGAATGARWYFVGGILRPRSGPTVGNRILFTAIGALLVAYSVMVLLDLAP